METTVVSREEKVSLQEQSGISGKWTTTDKIIQYLRELAVLEIMYCIVLDNDPLSEDPHDNQLPEDRVAEIYIHHQCTDNSDLER